MAHIRIGDYVDIPSAEMGGRVTRVTKADTVWVAVRRRWGGHHHPYKSKTFRFPRTEVIVRDSD